MYEEVHLKTEYETGEMLFQEMKGIGLEQVEKDRIQVDAWEFQKAVMEYTDEAGKIHTFQLGAYQIAFHTGGPQEFAALNARTA